MFSKLTATAVFHKVKLAKLHKVYTTYIATFGRYHFFRLPFGLTPATEYFQKVARIFKDQERYLIGDVILFKQTRSERNQ